MRGKIIAVGFSTIHALSHSDRLDTGEAIADDVRQMKQMITPHARIIETLSEGAEPFKNAAKLKLNPNTNGATM